MKDGEYRVDVKLSGGSGKASVKSPTRVEVKDGKIEAEIRWDSPNYDYMEIEGEEYYPVNEDGDSVFIVDAELDREIPVKAETLAMSEPHMIDYTLYFDSASLKKEESGSALIALTITAAVLVGFIAALMIRKRMRHEK